MPLHFNNGQVLLKNVNTDDWYYASVVINEEGKPVTSASQTATEITATDYSPYVVLKLGLNYYKIIIASFEGIINIGFDFLTTPEPPVRLFLKGNNGVFYEIIMALDIEDQEPEIAVVIAGTTTIVFNLPWKKIIPADFRVLNAVVVSANS